MHHLMKYIFWIRSKVKKKLSTPICLQLKQQLQVMTSNWQWFRAWWSSVWSETSCLTRRISSSSNKRQIIQVRRGHMIKILLGTSSLFRILWKTIDILFGSCNNKSSLCPHHASCRLWCDVAGYVIAQTPEGLSIISYKSQYFSCHR